MTDRTDRTLARPPRGPARDMGVRPAPKVRSKAPPQGYNPDKLPWSYRRLLKNEGPDALAERLDRDQNLMEGVSLGLGTVVDRFNPASVPIGKLTHGFLVNPITNYNFDKLRRRAGVPTLKERDKVAAQEAKVARQEAKVARREARKAEKAAAKTTAKTAKQGPVPGEDGYSYSRRPDGSLMTQKEERAALRQKFGEMEQNAVDVLPISLLGRGLSYGVDVINEHLVDPLFNAWQGYGEKKYIGDPGRERGYDDSLDYSLPAEPIKGVRP